MTSPHADQALGSLLTTPDYQAFCRVELDDPYGLLDTLRSIAPVHWSPVLDAWVVTSYEDVTAALGHPRLSSDRSAINAAYPTCSAPRTARSSPQRSPGDDLLTRLVSSTAEGTISDDELIGLSVFFLAAGHRTTPNLVASGLYLPLNHPPQVAETSP